MSDTLKIKCNNQPRDLITWFDLTPKEQAEFDYIDTEDKQIEAEFFRYKGVAHDTHEFMRIDRNIAPHCQRPQWEKFDGYFSDSFFSGVLIRYTNHMEQIVAASYYS